MKHMKLTLGVTILLILGAVASVTGTKVEARSEKANYCIAFLHEEGKLNRPLQCFTDRQQFERQTREIEGTPYGVGKSANASSSSLVLLAQIWDNSNYTGSTMKIYGSGCNVAGWLFTLDVMNNRASSRYLACVGQVSGYYYNFFCNAQNLNLWLGSCVMYSQVNSAAYSSLSWPFNNNWESFANTCCQDRSDIPPP